MKRHIVNEILGIPNEMKAIHKKGYRKKRKNKLLIEKMSRRRNVR